MAATGWCCDARLEQIIGALVGRIVAAEIQNHQQRRRTDPVTTITQNITDIAGATDNTSWTFYTEQIRQYGTDVITTKKVRKYPVAGVLTVVLDPGPAVVIAPDGKHYPFTVPGADSQLWPLIQAAVTIPPSTRHQELLDAVTAWLDLHIGAADEYHEYANQAAFPGTGVLDRLYLALDTGKLYRWTGSAYLQIADKASVGLGAVDNTSDMNKPVSTAQAAADAAVLAAAQPVDSDLTAIAALASAANKVPYATGAGAWALADLTPFARTVLDDADGATVRATIAAALIDAFPVGYGAFSGVLTHLNHGRSTVLQAVGDSTVQGAPDGGWFGRIGDTLGAYYDANVWHCAWNDTNQSYDAPTVRHTSTQGQRTATALGCQYAAASVTGDLEVIVKATIANWTGVFQQIIGKWGGAGAAGWGLFTDGGHLALYWSADGSTLLSANSGATIPFSGGATGWVRATFDVDNGASGWTIKFYTSTDGITWTQLGTDQTGAGTTSIFDNSSTPYQLGGADGSSQVWPMTGTHSWVQVRNALANGKDMVPRLPEQWGPSSFAPNTVSGGPLILLMNGGAGGTVLSYDDDSTRRPKLFTALYPDVVFVATGQNGGGLASPAQYAADYLTFINNVKTLRPNVPIIATTQNPTILGTAVPSTVEIQARYARFSQMSTAMASQPGVTVLDTQQAYTNTGTQINSDGLHPTSAGYAAQAAWMLGRLAPLA